MTDTPRYPPYEALPNIQLLNRDIQAIKATLARDDAAYTALESAAPTGKRQFWMLTVDLFRRIMEYAEAANLLLAWGAVVPFFPVLRALYESFTTFAYLSHHAAPEFEAQVAFAHEYYRAHRRWVDRGSRADERARIDTLKARLDAHNLDQAVLDAAEARSGSFDWTGRRRVDIIESVAGSRDEYDLFYSRLTQVTHPHTLVGGYMRDYQPEELEALAHRVRCHLRDAWSHMKYWMPVPLTDPWLDDPGSQV